MCCTIVVVHYDNDALTLALKLKLGAVLHATPFIFCSVTFSKIAEGTVLLWEAQVGLEFYFLLFIFSKNIKMNYSYLKNSSHEWYYHKNTELFFLGMTKWPKLAKNCSFTYFLFPFFIK